MANANGLGTIYHPSESSVRINCFEMPVQPERQLMELLSSTHTHTHSQRQMNFSPRFRMGFYLNHCSEHSTAATATAAFFNWLITNRTLCAPQLARHTLIFHRWHFPNKRIHFHSVKSTHFRILLSAASAAAALGSNLHFKLIARVAANCCKNKHRATGAKKIHRRLSF